MSQGAPVPTPRPAAVLAVVAVGTFMSALGASLVNIALPTIRRDLDADIGTASWVAAAYSLVVTALLLSVGRLGDMLGKRRVYAAGFTLFGVGSVLSGVAPSIGVLVASRALTGAGASMLMAIGPALATAAFPPAQRGRALGISATATYIGLTMGPSLGGALAQHLGWHAVFWVNVPVAAVGLVATQVLLHPAAHPPASGPAEPFPWVSALLVGPSLGALVVAATRGQGWGWSSAATLGTAAVGLVLFAAFLGAEQRSRAPLVSAALLFQPAMAGGLAAAFLQYASSTMLLFLLPFYLQGPLRMDAGGAGVVMTVQPAVMALLTGASGWLSDRVGTRAPSVAGMFLLGAGLVRVAFLGAQPAQGALIGAMVLVGLGAGLFTSPNNSGIMGAAPRARQGTAAGLLAEARNVGMLAGVTAASALFTVFGGARPSEAKGEVFVAAFRQTILAAAAMAALGLVISLVRPAAAPEG